MEEFYFDFFNVVYTDEMVIERANQYCKLVNEAFGLLETHKIKDKNEAFNIFKTINKCLRFEAKQYSNITYGTIPQEFKTYNEYVWAINDIKGHWTNTNSKEMLTSNLYDVSSYFSYYLKGKINA